MPYRDQITYFSQHVYCVSYRLILVPWFKKSAINIVSGIGSNMILFELVIGMAGGLGQPSNSTRMHNVLSAITVTAVLVSVFPCKTLLPSLVLYSLHSGIPSFQYWIR